MAENNKLSDQLLNPSRNLDSVVNDEKKKSNVADSKNPLSVSLTDVESADLALDADNFYPSFESDGDKESVYYKIDESGKIKIKSSNDFGDMSYFDLDAKIESLKKESESGLPGVDDVKLNDSFKSEKSKVLNSALTLRERIAALPKQENPQKAEEAKKQETKKETAKFVSQEKKEPLVNNASANKKEPVLSKLTPSPESTNKGEINNAAAKPEPAVAEKKQQTASFLENKPEVSKKVVKVSEEEEDTIRKKIILQNPDLEKTPGEIDRMVKEEVQKSEDKLSQKGENSESFKIKNEPSLNEVKDTKSEKQEAKTEKPDFKSIVNPSGLLEKVKKSGLLDSVAEKVESVKSSFNKDSLNSLLPKRSAEEKTDKPNLGTPDKKIEDLKISPSDVNPDKKEVTAETKGGSILNSSPNLDSFSNKYSVEEKLEQSLKIAPSVEPRAEILNSKMPGTPALINKAKEEKESSKKQSANVLEKNESKLSPKPQEIKNVPANTSDTSSGNVINSISSLESSAKSAPSTDESKKEPEAKKEETKKETKSESPFGGSDMDEVKSFLASIAKSLKGPLTIYDPEPFRPDSRRI